MNIYQYLFLGFIILGTYLTVSSGAMTAPPHDVTALEKEVAAMKNKLLVLESDKAAASNKLNNNKEILNIIHSEVLEIIRAERSIYDKIQDSERHTSSFILSMLGIVIAAIGLLGFMGVQYFIKKIAEKAENDLEGTIHSKIAQAQATIFNHMGFFRYQQALDKPKHSKEYNDLLNAAISSTEYAYEAFNELPHRGDIFAIKHQVMNNLAYYLTVRGHDRDRDKALMLADKAQAFGRKKETSRWFDWIESYAFVLLNCGLPYQQEYAFKHIDDLLARNDITDLYWKEKIKAKWEGLKRDYEAKKLERIKQEADTKRADADSNNALAEQNADQDKPGPKTQ